MTFFGRIVDRIRQLFGNVNNDGKLIILIGTRGTGKSETIKVLCRNLPGQKYIIRPNQDFLPQPIHEDERGTYQRIRNCTLVENEEDFEWEPGYYVLEDFPMLTSQAGREFYNELIVARHHGINIIILAHEYSVIRRVFPHANALLLYHGAVISPQALNQRVGGNGRGYAITRAVADLPIYSYRLISFDHSLWTNTQINSRNIDLVINLLQGHLNPNQLSAIDYPRRNVGNPAGHNENKAEDIKILLQEGFSPDEIATALETSSAYVWKVKCITRKQYTDENGTDNIPLYLQDGRQNGDGRG
jgi:hypothetical protein